MGKGRHITVNPKGEQSSAGARILLAKVGSSKKQVGTIQKEGGKK